MLMSDTETELSIDEGKVIKPTPIVTIKTVEMNI